MPLDLNHELTVRDLTTKVLDSTTKVATANLQDGAVTAAKLADMAQATVKGRASGAGTGDPTDLTAAQLEVILGLGVITLTANDFGPLAGAPSYSNAAPANRRSGWLLDSATTERVDATVWIPSGWATATFTIEWANAGAGAGDVRWAITRDAPVDGTDLTGFPALQTVVVHTAGTQWINKLAVTAAAAVTPGRMRLYVDRIGGDATDTLGNDAAFYSLTITRVT